MKNAFRSFLILLSILSVCVFEGEAQRRLQYSSEAERLFKEGVALFSSARYEQAAVSFERVIKGYPLNQRTTAAYLMRSKSLMQLDDEPEGIRVLREFLAQFPTSTYVSDAHFTLGLALVKTHRYDEAMQSLLTGWRAVDPHQAKLANDIRKAMEGLINGQLSVTAIRRLIEESRTDQERLFFLVNLAEKELAWGNATAAARTLDTLMVRYPRNEYGDRIAALRKRTEQRSIVKIAALLPVMLKSGPSALKEIGMDVYEGIQFAVEQYSKDPSAQVKVSLQLNDTERDPIVALRKVHELAADEEIVAILGPVFSATTSSAAGVANQKQIPLITPTANANGIAAEGPYVFQANPDYEVRGRAMARYAVTGLGMTTLAVLAPSDSYGKNMADAFIDEARRLNAFVVATEWYQRGASDLKEQLSNIRRIAMTDAAEPILSFGGKLSQSDLSKLMMLGVPPKTIDSLVEKGSAAGAWSLLGSRAKRKIDSLGISATYAPPKVDSLQYPVQSVHGIYIPISSPDEIGIVSSQLVYFNFQTQLLGSGEWYNLAELNSNKRYCNGVIFESDNLVDPDNRQYGEWMARFVERYKKRPSKNTLFGYDSAELLLQLIRGGNSTRERLRNALSRVEGYQGLHSRMGFSSRRVNPWVSILQYQSDQIRRIAEINGDQP